MNMDKTLTVRGTADQLLKYVCNQFKDDINSFSFAEEAENEKAKECCYQALTDALIRYNEGISTALASQEMVINTSSENVKWVSNDGIHSISFSGSLKSMVNELIRSVPVFIFGWLAGDSFVFVSTFFQAMISSLMDNAHTLEKNEPYIYALCLDFTKNTDNKYFSVEDLLKHNKSMQEDQIKVNEHYEAKSLDEGQIQQTCESLCEYKLLRHSGTRYKIIW